MKRLCFCLTTLWTIVLVNPSMSAQKNIENVIVAEFESPYDVITIFIDEEQYDYQVTDKTDFIDKKKKKINAELFSKGCAIDLSYEIEKKKRLATTIKMVSNEKAGTENFKGVFELLEDDLAYIDGRKVRLSRDAIIDCSGKSGCGCSKGMSYIDFSELKKGDFVTINGVAGDHGIVFANQVTVCKNEYTETDRKLRTAVENSFDARGTSIVSPPTGIVVPPNSLHQGNIKIGNLQYKLLDDIRTQGYVNMVGNRILPDYARDEAYQNKHNIFFRFYVIQDPIPNAFAFPNGMVFIHTGLLQLMENEAQLAAVLGHEIAHVNYEHSSSRYQSQGLLESEFVKNSGKTLLKNLTKRVNQSINQDGVGGDIIDGIGKGIAQTKPSDISNLFEKSKETQADRVGLFYMYMAGYDVREAANFWKIMSNHVGDETYQAKLKSDARALLHSNAIQLDQNFISSLTEEAMGSIVGNYLETIYTSHPLTQKRLKDINRLLLTAYSGEDFSQAIVGKEEYKSFIR